MTLAQILDRFPDGEFLQADGFEDAVLGVDVESMRLIYSKGTMIRVLLEDMDYAEAVEYLEFNTWGAYMGDKTPIWCDDLP